jgi:hypothetical protein
MLWTAGRVSYPRYPRFPRSIVTGSSTNAGRSAPSGALARPGEDAVISTLDYEERIVWLGDVAELDYVRQTIFPTARPVGRPASWVVGRLVGYAEWCAAAPVGQRYERRVFYLLADDRDGDPTGVYRACAPVEAVDPRTVVPGRVGRLTERAWGGPLPQLADRPVAVTLYTPQPCPQPDGVRALLPPPSQLRATAAYPMTQPPPAGENRPLPCAALDSAGDLRTDR